MTKLVKHLWAGNQRLLVTVAIVYMFSGALGVALSPLVAWDGEKTGNTAESLLQLVQHNALTVIVIAAGGLTLGISTIALIVLNGATLGLAIALALRFDSWAAVLLALLPHGILEIPATLLAGAAGLKMTQFVLAHIRGGPPSLSCALKEVVVLAYFALCLVVLAAPIEVYVSLKLSPSGT
jgi:stage II sporulation protein M